MYTKINQSAFRTLPLSIKPGDFDSFLRYGSLPCSLELREEEVYEQVGVIIEKVVRDDLPTIKNLSKTVIDKAWNLLTYLSESEKVNYKKMMERLGIAKATLKELLDVLLKSGLIVAIKPYGSAGKMSRKSRKYLFTASVIRSSLLSGLGKTLDSVIKGKLLEELVAVYLLTSLPKEQYSLFYDAEKGGADSILVNKRNNSKIVLEVGYGSKGKEQVFQTMEKVKAKYGIIIADTPLQLEDTIISLPKVMFIASL